MGNSPYIPALKYRILTQFYDPVLRWTSRESVFKNRLLEQGRIEPGHQVLDLGCGTGTLTIMLKNVAPKADVTGIDADPEALGLAKAKAALDNCDQINFDQGNATELPYSDGSFDRVFSSLLFHHLNRTAKTRAFQEIRRVLRPGAELHVADWSKASNPIMRLAFLGVQLLDGFETTADNVNGLLPSIASDAGFEDWRQTACYSTVFGTLAIFRASKSI